MSGRAGTFGTASGSGRPWGVYTATGVLFLLVTVGLAMPHRHRALFAADAPGAPLQAARQLRFVELPHDDLAVSNAATGQRIALVPAGENGFLHGMVHGLSATRRRIGVDPARPYALSLYDDGRLVLSDPPTGTAIDIEGFGPTNEATLLRFLGSPGIRP